MTRFRGLKAHVKPGYKSKFHCLCRSCCRYSAIKNNGTSAYVKTATSRYTRRTLARTPIEMPEAPLPRMYVYHAS